MTDKNMDFLVQLAEYASKLSEEDKEKLLIYTNAYIDGKNAGIKAAS